tara:strand:+ start:126 stop:353 length:228 start_codon:yes stop_codon:yes gene_type:complete
MNIPKDRKIIIDHKTGRNVAIWSEADKKFAYANLQADKKFAYANLQADMYGGEYDMMYFETQYIDEKDIIYWRDF